MGKTQPNQEGPSGLLIRGIPVTRRNIRNLVAMSIAALAPANATVLARNARAARRPAPWRDFLARHAADGAGAEAAAEAALAWICRSQDRVGSGGVGDFEFQGWTPGYPEVTGYIIPTFWDYSEALGRPELAERAVRMAEWELRVQKPGGGFESLYEGEGQPPVAFNTGQVIRGLVRTHAETQEQRFLDAAVRAGEWMVANQEADGSWTKANYLGMKRTYDAYAAAGLAQLGAASGERRFLEAAVANCEFAVSHQLDNGWFELCDNTPKGNDAPITHTLCYTADGLIETGEITGEQRLVEAGERCARALIARVEDGGRLAGRFDREWRPQASYVVLTGSAQLGVLAMKLHARQPDAELLRAARELRDFLAYVQKLNAVGDDRSGGIAGSFPIWGRYVPLKYPSWATKFFLDHLRLLDVAERAAVETA